MRRLIALMGCVAAIALVAGCGGGGDSTESTVADTSGSSQDTSPIVIGAAVGQTGFMQAYDGAPTEALKLAVKERNAAGGIDGRRIDLRIKDTASDRAKAKTVANELVSEGAEMLVVSCDFDFGAPAAQVAQQAGKVAISLCAQSLKFGVQGIGPLAFTPAASAVDEGAATAEWALEKQNWESAFVLEDPTVAYTEEACSGFKDRYTDKGGEIAGEAAFKNEDPSIATQIGDIKKVQSKVDFIRLCSYPPGSGTAIRQIRAAGIDLPIVGVGAMDGTYWLEAIPNISDLYYPAAGSIYGDDPNPEVNKIVSEYEQVAKGEPANAYVLFGQALLELYAQGVEAAGSSDPEEVAAAMSEFKEVPSVVGSTTYTDEIHIALDRPWVFIKVTNGKPAYLETFTASEPAPFELG